jgi:hypothetical protein
MRTNTNHRERRHTAGSILSAAWDSAMVRYSVLAVALGAVPFYFLSLAVAHIGG